MLRISPTDAFFSGLHGLGLVADGVAPGSSPSPSSSAPGAALRYHVSNGIAIPDDATTLTVFKQLQLSVIEYDQMHRSGAANVSVDGRIGPLTVKGVQAALRHASTRNPRVGAKEIGWAKDVTTLARMAREVTGLLLPGVATVIDLPGTGSTAAPRYSTGKYQAAPARTAAATGSASGSTFRNADGSLKSWVLPASIGAAALVVGAIVFASRSPRTA